MKTLNLLLMLLLVSWSVALAQSPVIGTWTGTYGTGGTTQTPNFFSLKFNADGTMQVLNQSGGVIAQGRAAISNNNVSGSYTYTGQSSATSLTGVYNPSSNTITGTWGSSTSQKGGGGWIMTSKSGGSVPAATSIPFGSKGTYTKAPPSAKQTAATQPMKVTPKPSTGMVITGEAAMPPTYTLPANDPSGVRVITRLEPAQGVSEANYPKIQVNDRERTPDGSDIQKDCYAVKRKITATSNHFLNTNYGARSSNVYPGAIYEFSEFMNGNYKAIETSRNPVVLSTSNMANTTGNVSKEVPVPDMANLRQAISDIVKPFENNVGSGNLEAQTYEGNNSAEMSIAATAGGGYAGFTASAGFNRSNRNEYYYFTVDAMKPMFTIDVNIPPNGFFSDKSVLSNYKNPVVIKSVVYGTRILANVESRFETTREGVNFKAALNSWGVTADAAFDYLRNTSAATRQINLIVFGGPTTTTIPVNPSNLREGISDIMAHATLKMAQPIAFVLADINGNTYRIVSATDEYPDRDCVPKLADFRLSKVSVNVLTGTDPKDQGSTAEFDLYTYSVDKKFSWNTYTSPAINIEFPSTTGFTGNSIDLSPLSNDPAGKSFLEQVNGGYLDIFFTPRQIALGWDEWNIKGLKISLVFKDQFNNEILVKVEKENLNIWMRKNEQRLRMPFTINDPENVDVGLPFMPR